MTTAIETEGTLSIPANWHVDHSGGTPSLIVTLDMGDLPGLVVIAGLGDLPGIAGVGEWQFAAVADAEPEPGADLTLRYVPNGAVVA